MATPTPTTPPKDGKSSKSTRTYSPQTQVMHHGYTPEWSEGAITPPVFRTSTFLFKNCEEGKRAFEIAYGLKEPAQGEVPALIYTRVNNPNSEILEDRITVWDPRAEAAALFSSGMGAISTSCLAFLRPGDELLFTDPVYGGTEFLFRKTLPSFQIPTRAIPAGSSEAEIEAAMTPKTKIVYVETPANPTIVVTDIAAAARVVARRNAQNPNHRVLLLVDNTFLGPIFCKPHGLGADVVLYSATKFIGGHSDLVAGIATGSRADIGLIKGMRTILGSIQEADTAWLLTRSLPTLELRMRAAAESAVKITALLCKHPAVTDVYYPGLATMGPEQTRIFREQYTGTGSVITFKVRGGEKEAFTVLDKLHTFRLAVSLGGVETLIQHPSSMTHSDMEPHEKVAAGITENMIRASIGLEDVNDLLTDLSEALDSLL